MEYNHQAKNFDHLIGKTLREANFLRIGEIVEIDYFVDGYGHDNAWAVCDNGRRINCLKIERAN